MKAPDKIYVEVCDDGIFAFPEPPFAESVEYIRADLVKQPVVIRLDNPNIEKIDPNIKVETRTDGTGDIDGKAMLYVADKSYKIGFRDGKASKEQPAEGLLEEVDRFWANEFKYHVNSLPTISVVQRIARHFAEWQKKQDQETIELAEDHAMLAGMNKMEQQMMEKAVECVVENWNPEPHPEITIPLNPEVFGVGDKVRVIVIKED